jgi:hypothetical protein
MNDKGRSGNINLGHAALMPKEEQLEMAVKHKRISIGIPK